MIWPSHSYVTRGVLRWLGFARSGIAHQDHGLPPLEVLAPRQLQDQRSGQRRLGREVEVVQRLDLREARCLDPPLRRPPAAVGQLPLAQSQQEAEVINSIWAGPFNEKGERLWGALPRGTPFDTLLTNGNAAPAIVATSQTAKAEARTILVTRGVLTQCPNGRRVS